MSPGRMTGHHDRFFRYLFNHRGRVEALLRHNLPAPLVAAIDWSTLRRESGTLADWDRETRKDLLFSARYLNAPEDAPPHFFIIEHQSTVERQMAVRAGEYCWRLILHWRESHPRSPWIPAVTPLVVYARRGRNWSAPRRLEDHYPLPDGAACTWHPGQWSLRLEYLLDDLSTQSEEALLARPGPPLVALGLLVLRFAGTKELAEKLPHWRELFAQVYAGDYGPQKLYRVVRYLHKLGDERAYEAVKRVLHSVMKPERAEAFMRTMAEVLEERGHKRGVAEGEARGEAKGLAKAVLRALANRGVRVDEHSRQRIQACTDAATLERWLEQALGAARLSEVLDGPAQ